MTSRNPYFSKLPTSSKAKPTQSQSPLHKKQYYKFFAENSNRQTEQTFHGQRAVEQIIAEPPKEKKEEFKKEIERRFLKSTVNPGFRFPKHSHHDDASDSLSDSSIDSLERLSHTAKYDLHSQNLRYYAKSQAAHTFEDRKKTSVDKSNKASQQLKTITLSQDNIDQYNKPYSTYDNRVSTDIAYTTNGKSDAEMSSVYQKKAADKMKTDPHYDHSNPTSRETNDTAFSTLNKATSSGFFNYPQFITNPTGTTVNQFTPTYNPRSTASKNRLVSDLRQSTPKEMKLNNISASTKSITTTRQTSNGSRATQMSFFPSKNINSSVASASARIAFKKTAAAGFRSGTNYYGTQNNTEINNMSSEKSLGGRMNETEKFFSVKGISENLNKKMFTTYDTDQESSTRGLSRDQLRNTSNLYNKTQNDLIKKLKMGESGLVVINETANTYQASTTSKARQTENLFGKPFATKPLLSPRTQNYMNGVNNYVDSKKQIEVRGIKHDSSRPMTISSHLDQSGQNTSHGYSHLQKLMERTSSPYSTIRSPSSRQGDRISTDRMKYGLK